MSGPVITGNMYGKSIRDQIVSNFIKKQTPIQENKPEFFEFGKNKDSRNLGEISNWRNSEHYKIMTSAQQQIPILQQRLSHITDNLKSDVPMPILKGLADFESKSLPQLASMDIPAVVVGKLNFLTGDVENLISAIKNLQEPFQESTFNIGRLSTNYRDALEELKLIPSSKSVILERAGRILDDYNIYLHEVQSTFQSLRTLEAQANQAKALLKTYIDIIYPASNSFKAVI